MLSGKVRFRGVYCALMAVNVIAVCWCLLVIPVASTVDLFTVFERVGVFNIAGITKNITSSTTAAMIPSAFISTRC